jgi:hypothetical protein
VTELSDPDAGYPDYPLFSQEPFLVQRCHSTQAWGAGSCRDIFFDLRFPDRTDDDEGGAVFTGDGAAVIYANRIIGELKEAGGYDEPGLLMIVRKDASQKEISIPFQAVPSVCR